jgi:hypothetical protein
MQLDLNQAIAFSAQASILKPRDPHRPRVAEMTLSRGVPMTSARFFLLFVFALGWRSVVVNFYCGDELRSARRVWPRHRVGLFGWPVPMAF